MRRQGGARSRLKRRSARIVDAAAPAGGARLNTFIRTRWRTLLATVLVIPVGVASGTAVAWAGYGWFLALPVLSSIGAGLICCLATRMRITLGVALSAVVCATFMTHNAHYQSG